jgi:hypothetical protein
MIPLLIAGQALETQSKPQTAEAEDRYYRSHDATTGRRSLPLASTAAVLGLIVLAFNLLPR